ncbi:hypothetical protein LJK88_40280 [Paenibacillus sp. P26]|nr:hypothetical protein LJK88_40280 [Paenibacillus sp. P26]
MNRPSGRERSIGPVGKKGPSGLCLNKKGAAANTMTKLDEPSISTAT